MRKKTLGIALIMAMGAALYGCGTTEPTEADVNVESEGPAAVADESEDDNPANDQDLQDENEENIIDDSNEGPSADASLTDSDEAGPGAGKEGMSGDDADAKRQIEIITNNADKWIENSDVEYYYTVTDLDHDGHLEVISATNQGSGLYTYLKMFEVDDTNDGLTEIACGDTEMEGGVMDIPDIIINGNFVTYNKGSEYIYIASDFIKGSGTESCEAIEAFKLDGTNLYVETLARKNMDGDNVSYENIDGSKTLTEDEFLNIADSSFGDDYTKYETTFLWDLLEGDDMSNKLLDCYKAFAGR